MLANHGVHVAGTDFDRQVDLSSILPLCGYRSVGPSVNGREPREVPSRVYFDLATWHLINTVYTPSRVHELRRMRGYYGDASHYLRVMRVVEHHLGHALLGQAEAAKIAVADGAQTQIDLHDVEEGLASRVDQAQVVHAIDRQMDAIVDAARETLRMAGLHPDQIDVAYFTGGSTGFGPLVQRISAAVPGARAIQGDRDASVAQGLGIYAQRLYRKA